MSKVKNLDISQFFFGFFFSGYVVAAMIIVINSVIGGFSCVDLVWLADSTVQQPTAPLHSLITNV